MCKEGNGQSKVKLHNLWQCLNWHQRRFDGKGICCLTKNDCIRTQLSISNMIRTSHWKNRPEVVNRRSSSTTMLNHVCFSISGIERIYISNSNTFAVYLLPWNHHLLQSLQDYLNSANLVSMEKCKYHCFLSRHYANDKIIVSPEMPKNHWPKWRICDLALLFWNKDIFVLILVSIYSSLERQFWNLVEDWRQPYGFFVKPMRVHCYSSTAHRRTLGSRLLMTFFGTARINLQLGTFF